MATTVSYNIKIEPEIKEQFDEFCKKIGMNASTAFNVFIHAALREKRIPFELSAENDPFYTESNLAFLRESISAYKRGEFKEHDLIEAD